MRALAPTTKLTDSRLQPKNASRQSGARHPGRIGSRRGWRLFGVRPRPTHCVPVHDQFPVVRMSRLYAGFPGQLCITMILAEPSGFLVRR